MLKRFIATFLFSAIPVLASAQTLRPGDSLRVNYEFRANEMPTTRTVFIDDEVTIQAVFADMRIDPERFFAEETIAPDQLHPKPGDSVVLHLFPNPDEGIGPAAKAETTLGANEPLRVHFDLFPTELIIEPAARAEPSASTSELAPGDPLLIYFSFLPTPSAADHKLAATERVNLRLEFNAQYNLTALPASDGTIDFRLIGPMSVVGKTAAEIEAALTEKYEPLLGEEIIEVSIESDPTMYRALLEQIMAPETEVRSQNAGTLRTQVTSAGLVYLPVIGSIESAGMAVGALEDAIQQKYSERGYRDLTVMVAPGDPVLDAVPEAPVVKQAIRIAPVLELSTDHAGALRLPLLAGSEAVDLLGKTPDEAAAQIESAYASQVGPASIRIEQLSSPATPLLTRLGLERDGGTLRLEVREDGSIFLPAVGRIEAEGATLAEIDTLVRSKIGLSAESALRLDVEMVRASYLVLDHDSLNQTFKVSAEGVVPFPLGLRLDLRGKTEPEIQQQLVDYYSPLLNDKLKLNAFVRSNVRDRHERLRAAFGGKSIIVDVDRDGQIVLPLIDPVTVNGKTLKEAEEAAEAAYAERGQYGVAIILEAPSAITGRDRSR